MVYKIVIYGYAYGRGVGTGLLDLTYFIDDEVRTEDVLGIFNNAGFKLISKYIDGCVAKGREKDRVTIEIWDSHISNITVGSQRMEQPTSRYEYPTRDI